MRYSWNHLPQQHSRALFEGYVVRDAASRARGFGYMLYSEHDGLSVWLNEKLPANQRGNYTVGFAHRRLSIIDLSTASLQPMVDDTKSYCLVYNGELYNYLELKGELEKLGDSFRTTGDSEVVLKSYEAWGTDCFRQFNGMWALALLDLRNQCVVFSRDRFGIKPLYYTIAENTIYFASTVGLDEKQITEYVKWQSHQDSGQAKLEL